MTFIEALKKSKDNGTCLALPEWPKFKRLRYLKGTMYNEVRFDDGSEMASDADDFLRQDWEERL